jgi:hypothetical protein
LRRRSGVIGIHQYWRATISGELRRSIISLICRPFICRAGAALSIQVTPRPNRVRRPILTPAKCRALIGIIVIVAPLIDRMNNLGFSSLWDPAYPHVTD